MRTETPARSREQQLDALRKANAVRLARQGTKHAVAAGKRSVREVIMDPMDHEDGLKVVALLMAMPRVGPVKAEELMRRAELVSTKRVGGMTLRQRKVLLAVLGC